MFCWTFDGLKLGLGLANRIQDRPIPGERCYVWNRQMEHTSTVLHCIRDNDDFFVKSNFKYKAGRQAEPTSAVLSAKSPASAVTYARTD